MDFLTQISGVDVFIPEFGVMGSQPKIIDIAKFGEDNFFNSLSIFAGSDPEFYKERVLSQAPEEEKAPLKIELDYSITSSYVVFSRYCKNKMEQLLVESLLYLLFPSLRKVNWISLSETKIITQLTFEGVGNENNIITLDEKNFEALKTFVKDCSSFESEGDANAGPRPAGEMAQAIADKMAEAAKRRERIYGKKDVKKQDSMIGNLVSILATSDGISVNEVLNMTFIQVLIQLKRTQLFQQYRTQITLGAFGGLDADDIADWQEFF